MQECGFLEVRRRLGMQYWEVYNHPRKMMHKSLLQNCYAIVTQIGKPLFHIE
jgi:hypothetical protein